jgi:hypothetical protein
MKKTFIFISMLLTALVFSCNNSKSGGNGANMPAEKISPDNKGDNNYRPEVGDQGADVSTRTDSTRDNEREHSTH